MTKLYTDDAELYDIAFDWDVTSEVEWLLDRLGPDCRSLFEPGCGSGRMLEAFSSRGLEVVGLDSSPAMVSLARERLRGRGTVHLGDMTDFHLGRSFDGAVAPINTLLHLTPAELQCHLGVMAAHLEPGGGYLVQLGLVDPDQNEPFAGSHWDARRGETHLRIDWTDEELDLAGGRSLQRSRIQVLQGPRAGEVIEEVHEMSAWTPDAWHSAIARTPFVAIAAYDGAQEGWPKVDRKTTGGLLWHELRLPNDPPPAQLS